MIDNNKPIVLSQEELKSRLCNIRGLQVILDRDLAEIYGYTVKAFNQQVKNNIEKFDDDFRFQLTDNEVKELSRSKNLTMNSGNIGKRGYNIKYNPYAFTEQGIYMLMTVLKGSLAVSQSKALIRLFKQMKDYIVESQVLIPNKDILRLSMQITQNTRDIAEIKSEMATRAELAGVIHDFTDPQTRKEYLILNGESVEADMAYSTIYGGAKRSVYIIDNYIGLKTLMLLRAVNKDTMCTIFSDNVNHCLSKIELDDFKKEYPAVMLEFKKICNICHDRYIVLDYNTPNEKIYHCGASSKDSGKKINSIIQVEDIMAYHKIIDVLQNNPELEF